MVSISEFTIPNHERDAKKENYYYLISAANGINGTYCVYADRLPDLLSGVLGPDYLVATCKVGGGPSPAYDAHLYYAKSERKESEYFFKGFRSNPVVKREGVLVIDRCISAEEYHQLVALNYTAENQFNHIFEVKLDDRDDFTPRE